MKKSLFLILLLAFGLMTQAQNITVKSFRLLPDDNTATTADGKRIDQNGNVAALIKMVTDESGLNFEGGALGIVDAKHLQGEVWVWVPRSARKITVKHPKLGVLRDYRYPVEIQGGQTYEMVLEIEKVIEEEDLTEQFVSFNVTPPTAVLEVNDQEWPLSASGNVSRLVEFGTYTYRVRAEGYHPDAGKITVDDPKKPSVVTVNLRPNFSNVTLEVDADADIWVDGEPKGTRTWTGSLSAGVHQIECRQDKHETSVMQKTITDQMEGQVIRLDAPRLFAGSLQVNSKPDKATVFLDGKVIGETPLLLNDIPMDQYDLWVVKEGQYTDHFEKIDIRDKESAKVSCTLEKTDGYAFIVNGAPIIMKYVEGGTFLMGAQRTDPNASNYDSDARNIESPVHSVTLNSFYMGEIEVTRGLWRKVMESDSGLFFAYTRQYMTEKEKYEWDNYPVDNTSMERGTEFIRKLNKITKMNFRMPTEAEWEYAARGGKKSRGYIYAGSNDIDDVAWYYDNSKKEYSKGDFSPSLHPVKQKKPNELGLYDMSGNMSERCSDWYNASNYSSEPQFNPQGPSKESSFCGSTVLRGGNYARGKNECRVSAREGRNDGIGGGLRIVLPK